MDEETLKWMPEVEHQELELQMLTLVRWEMHREVAKPCTEPAIPHN